MLWNLKQETLPWELPSECWASVYGFPDRVLSAFGDAFLKQLIFHDGDVDELVGAWTNVMRTAAKMVVAKLGWPEEWDETQRWVQGSIRDAIVTSRALRTLKQ